MSVSLLAGSLFSTSYVYAEAHVDNPFVDATSYLNPDYSKDIDTSITKVSDVSLKEKMETIKNYPTGVWLDTIDAVKGGPKNPGRLNLTGHLDAALAQKKEIRLLQQPLLFMTCLDAIATHSLPMVNYL